MILADTSIWVDHLRRRDSLLCRHLDDGAILTHPFVAGELACGSLQNRARVLDLLSALPQAIQAADDEVLRLLERKRLWSLDIGWVDAHLLASCRLSRCLLWTRDQRLLKAAARAGVVAGST